MAGGGILALGCALAVIGVVLLRLAWARKSRSLPLTGGGWAALLLAVIAGWMAAGMWGSTVAALWAMGAALALLAHAAVTAPAGRAPASNRRVRMLPESGEKLRIGGRIATFAIVVVGGFLSAIGVALGFRWAWMAAGAGEANANAMALFMQPLAWAVIAFFLLMMTRRRAQIGLLLLAALAAVPAFLAGGQV